MEIFYKPQAVKQMKKLTARERDTILRKIVLLTTNPYAGKKLSGELTNLRSLRSWPFRIVYALEKNKVVIYSVAHRQSVYKRK